MKLVPKYRRCLFEGLEDRQLLAVGDLRMVSYNVLGGDGTPSAQLGTVLKAIGDEVVGGLSRPIDLLAIQEAATQTTTTAQVVSQLNAIYGAGTYSRGNLNGDSLSGNETVGLVYNTQSLQLLNETAIGTPSSSGMARQTIRYQLQPIGLSSEHVFYVYNSHYKANATVQDEARRAVEAAAIRSDSDALGQGKLIIYAGDFNMRSSSELAFQTLIGAGNGQGQDPLGRLGTWHNNSSFVDVFTQAPSINPPSGFVGGGIDDRFDFQLLTGEWFDGSGLEYAAGTYRSFGNNGSVAMNQSINHSNNTALPGLANRSTILDLLTLVSDHLPVVADYRLAAETNSPFVPYPGGTYTQNFDGLPLSGSHSISGSGPIELSASPILAQGTLGWSIARLGGTSTSVLFHSSDGESSAGGLQSYGTTGASDRAQGSLASGTHAGGIGLTLVNQSGLLINNFTIRLIGEWWRRGGTGTIQRLTFSYGIGVESLMAPGTGSFISDDRLDFLTPSSSTSLGSNNGNADVNRRERLATFADVRWLPGQRLVLRWIDANDPGNDDGLAIDDFVFSSVTNLPPTDINFADIPITENVSTSNAPRWVGTLSAVDPDISETWIYSLVAGDGDDHNSKFAIEGNRVYLRQGESVDYESLPEYALRVRVTDSAGGYHEEPFRLPVINLLEVAEVKLNDGGPQRSQVDRLTVTWDSQIEWSPEAFEVVRRGDPSGVVQLTASHRLTADGRSQIELRFSGSPTVSGSLIDGNYQLKIFGERISNSTLGAMDGDRDGTAGGNWEWGALEADRFFRYFGDSNGDRIVGTGEFNEFRATFGKRVGDLAFNDLYDFDRNGLINSTDFNAIRNRFGRRLTF